jgi:RHS repeat-associated protein
MTRAQRIFFAALIAVIASVPISAQVPTGTPPLGSYSGGPDVIDLAYLNSHITIPVLHKPGRGTNFTYDLTYDSSVWYPVTSSGTTSWQPVTNWGWGGQTQIATGYISFTNTSTPVCWGGPPLHLPNGWTITTSNWKYHDSWGATHSFPGSTTYTLAPCKTFNETSFNTTATDGSGFSISALGLTATIADSHGTVVNAPYNSGTGAGNATDRNGNEITADGTGKFYDTISSTTPVLTVAGTPPSNTTFTYTNPSNTSSAYTMKYTTFTIQTKFGCSGITEYGAAGTTTAPLVTEIDLPDISTNPNDKYTFTYETTYQDTHTPHYVTGRLASVTLPTGGTISYQYSTGSSGANGITCADGSAATLVRTTPDTGSNAWTYVRSQVSGTHWQTIVTDPTTAANQTSIQFQGLYETQHQIYQGSTGGTLLQTVNTCYNAATSPCTGTAITLPITQVTTLATIPGSGNLIAQHTEKFDSFGNSTESDDYDFATAAPYPLLRQTLVSYATLGGNLNAFRQTIIAKDGSGNIKSRQDTNYDQYSSFTGTNCITGAPNHDDTGHGCSFTARANATSVTSYTDPVTPGGAIIKSYTYDSLGNLRTAQLDCCQLKTWNFSVTTQYAYPDTVVSGSSSPQLTTQSTYDLHMGLVLTATDPNNLQAAYTYDNLGRPLTVKIGTNPANNFTYTDPNTVLVCSPVVGTNTVCNKAILDGLGRTKTTQLLDGSSTIYSATDTQYDALGRAYKVSNPYTGSPTYWTQTSFDTLGRPITATLPDNSVSSISYTDNYVITTDPANKQRKLFSDGLGRLTNVVEPDPSNNNSLSIQTSYAYNVFNQLTSVTQGVQTRTNAYDALGRLLSTVTPEGGTVCYGTYSGGNCQANGYDFFNNLTYRTDARGVVTTYLYDNLNRLIGVAYPTVPSPVAPMPNVCKVNGAPTNNANVCFVYGTTAASYNNGRMISMSDPSGSESYTYDQLGNLSQLSKVIGTNTYTTSYSYNLEGGLTQITYPSGRVVQQSTDAIGRLCEVAPSTSACGTAGSPFATGLGYNTANQMTGLKYGNGIFASFGFSDNRLQLSCIDYSTTNRNGYCSHDSTTKFGLTYSYQASPNNNGQISGITDSVDSGRSGIYTYDSLYRLTNASISGSANFPAWGLSETYDRYGNRSTQGTSSGCTGITCPTNSVTVNTATNQISGSPYAYDLSGDMTNDGQNALVYDGESRIFTATAGSNSGSYSYDGNSLRVQKISVIGGTTTTTAYVISGSKVIAEYDNGALPSAPTREYIYAGNILLAKIDSSGNKYYHRDHLSNRLVTDSGGNTVAQMGHFPFGESWYNASNDKLIFTSYERDSESGNDYAKARYYISRLARFSSTDPVPGNPSNPQSWNEYSYVQNDPINLVDPEGEYCSWEDGTWDDPSEAGGASFDECQAQGGSWVDDSQWTSASPGQPVLADRIVQVTATGGGDDILQVNSNIEGTLEMRQSVGTLYPKAALLALRFSLNPDCAKFLNSVGQSALLQAFQAIGGMKPGAPFQPTQEGQYMQAMWDNYSAIQPGLTAFGSTAFVQSGVNPGDGGYTTIAEIDRTQANTIDFYKGFTSAAGNPNFQAKVILHEGMHEATMNATDQMLAAAAGVEGAANMSISEASSKFQAELEKHCKKP